MKQNNSTNLSPWQKFLRISKNFLKFIKKNNRRFNKKYPNILQSVQLTFIYFFAILSLFYSMFNVLGQIPDVFLLVIPSGVQDIINSPILRFALAPEKSYVVYLFVIEFIIFRSIFNFSLLLKYNLLLIFLLEMFQNLLISYWDLLFNRQVGPDLTSIDMTLAISFMSFLFVYFFFSYLHSYFCSIRGKFTTLPYMSWLTDSIAFWLRIKTPTMRNYGGVDKNKGGSNK